MIEIKHLNTLHALKVCDSLADAAVMLNLTLSAISHQVKLIEDYYQCKLFIRKTKPIQFTAKGKLLLDLAESVLPQIRATHQKLLQSTTWQPLNFNMALECHSCYQWLIPTLNDFRQQWSDIDTDLVAEFNFNPLPKLASGDLDIVITADPIYELDLTYFPLFDFEMVIGIARKNPLSNQEYLVPADIAKETIIIYPVDTKRLSIFTQFFDPADITPYKIRHTELTLMMIELTACGRGICCLPNWAFSEFQSQTAIKTMRMGEKGVFATLYIACRPEDKNRPLILDFIRLAKHNSNKILTNYVTIH